MKPASIPPNALGYLLLMEFSVMSVSSVAFCQSFSCHKKEKGNQDFKGYILQLEVHKPCYSLCPCVVRHIRAQLAIIQFAHARDRYCIYLGLGAQWIFHRSSTLSGKKLQHSYKSYIQHPAYLIQTISLC